MDENKIELLREKSSTQRRGICQRCGVESSTSKVAVMAHEKVGDAGAEENSEIRGQQKFKNIASKSNTLCDDCCVTVYSALIDTLNDVMIKR